MVMVRHSEFEASGASEVTLPNWQITLEQMIADGEQMTSPTAFEEQNELALAAASDNEIKSTAHTAIHSTDKRKDDAARHAKIVMQASASANADYSIDISKLTLSSDSITIAANGILQIDGREATLEEKMVLEENSGACSVGVTQTELDIEEFLAGRTNEVPEALQEMAEERGITNPSMEDYQDMVREEFPIHISSRMISGGINFNDPQSLLPQLSSDFSTVTADGPMSTPAADLSAESLLPPKPVELPQSTPMPG